MPQKLQNLPGFRDHYPEACAIRNYIFETWRRVVAGYGFSEYEGPILEPTELYRKKSGDEIVEQLFHFVDRGDREVAMRPELTPTLARMAAPKQREYRKPMKWFGIGPFFRYEKQQKGRLREFYQFNCDMMGEVSPQVDAELIAVAIDVMRAFGFGPEDFVIRVSDRSAWMTWLEEQGITEEKAMTVLGVIDKLERESPEKADAALLEAGTSLEAVRNFMASDESVSERMPIIRENLKARGLDDYLRWDLGIVRGLAYYTSTVFEIFDIGKGMRAVAGGGRYDNLMKLIGGADLPAAGFAMGDVVIGDFIQENDNARARMEAWIEQQSSADAFVIVAGEENRSGALQCVQTLRDAGLRVEYSLTPRGVGKQFQAATQNHTRTAVVVGDEFPVLKVQQLSSREEVESSAERLLEDVRAFL